MLVSPFQMTVRRGFLSSSVFLSHPFHSISAWLDEDSCSNFMQYLAQRHGLHPEFPWGLRMQNPLQSMGLILIFTRLSEICLACLWHQSTKHLHCSRNTLCLGIEILRKILKIQFQVVENSISSFLSSSRY